MEVTNRMLCVYACPHCGSDNIRFKSEVRRFNHFKCEYCGCCALTHVDINGDYHLVGKCRVHNQEFDKKINSEQLCSEYTTKVTSDGMYYYGINYNFKENYDVLKEINDYKCCD
jgi:hypothetical protein